MEEEVSQEIVSQDIQEAPNAFAEAVGHAADDAFFKQTNGIWNWIKEIFTWENVFKCIGGILVVLALWLIYRLIRRGIRQIPEKKFSKAKLAIAEKIATAVKNVIAQKIINVHQIALVAKRKIILKI